MNYGYKNHGGSQLHYRPEIDGLRAIAVISVIFFHAGFQAFGGGFVGVDIFFVISGYLITSIIIKDMEEGIFSLVKFYERRVRRILPALFFVMAACIPFAWMWLMPEQMKGFSRSLIAVTSFSSNVLFWRESGYFDTVNELKPLLHTWSLAVEEQYYIVFPLFLLFFGVVKKARVFSILVTVFLLSLCFAQWGAYNKPTAAFYLLPTRGWEILLGALVAFHLGRNVSELPKRGGQILSLLGLSLIVFSIVFFDKGIPFPGIYALIPTLGSALLIIYARQETIAHRILNNRVLVGIGLISYSAYLWHQPLFAFAKHRSLQEPTILVMTLLSLSTFLLAYLTWAYVEKPFRHGGVVSRRGLFFLAIGIAAAFFCFGLFGYSTNGFEGREHLRGVEVKLKTVVDVHCHNQGKRTARQIADNDFCVEGGNQKRLAVIGDSHAGAIFGELGKRLKEDDIGFVAVSGGFCPPVFGFELDVLSAGCSEVTDLALRKIIENPSITTVVLDAEWGVYTKGYRDALSPSLAIYKNKLATSVADNPRFFQEALIFTVQKLINSGKTVIIIEPVPEFSVAVIALIEKQRLFDIDADYPQIQVNQYLIRNKEVFDIFRKMKGVKFVKTAKLFCDNAYCHSVDKAGNILISDSNHVTELGARLIANAVSEALN